MPRIGSATTTAPGCARDGGRVIRAAVVDDDNLVGRPGLRGERSETPLEHRPIVESWDDDGEAGHGPTSEVLHP